MRKKIPTITRPDPAYVASLRPQMQEPLARQEVQRAEAIAMPVSREAPVGEEHRAVRAETPPSPPRAKRIPATRKIDIRVNALERQEDALIDCGVDPAHVIRAALRRAVKNWHLGPDFLPPPEVPRTQITEWRARTSLAVDANALAALLRAHDPLDVLSKWALIRGQLEPLVWAQIDALLHEIADRSTGLRDAPDAAKT